MIIKKLHNKYPTSYSYLRHTLRFGNLGIKSLSSTQLTENQLLCLERAILKKLRDFTPKTKSYKFWSLLLLNKSLTKLNLESRMGKGKGLVYTKSVFIKPGTILFEFSNTSKPQVKKIVNFIKKKQQ
uniref:Ribosomal protein L16 n=1 Tax=Sporolithon durum TaxID=48970 RepID=V9P528_9FLOR|nr:ribosomal protein L16 [Sporolithon durum]AGU16676.1 ribosomal protein L16 [Sporolithon durum]